MREVSSGPTESRRYYWTVWCYKIQEYHTNSQACHARHLLAVTEDTLGPTACSHWYGEWGVETDCQDYHTLDMSIWLLTSDFWNGQVTYSSDILSHHKTRPLISGIITGYDVWQSGHIAHGTRSDITLTGYHIWQSEHVASTSAGRIMGIWRER